MGVSSDLTAALVNNLVFRHKVAAHDLLSYARKDSLEHLRTITMEQLQHGGMMTPSDLMPATAAKLIADSFFDFVLKHSLGDTIRDQKMSPDQIQVIALFLSYLQRNPPQACLYLRALGSHQQEALIHTS